MTATDTKQAAKQFNLMAIMMALIVLVFVGVASYAFIAGMITWEKYAAAVSLIVGWLVGYFTKGTTAGGAP